MMPDDYEAHGDHATRDNIEEFEQRSKPDSSEDEYRLCTEAVIAISAIEEVLPHKIKSVIIQMARPILSPDVPDDVIWHENVFEDDVHSQDVPYCKKDLEEEGRLTSLL